MGKLGLGVNRKHPKRMPATARTVYNCAMHPTLRGALSKVSCRSRLTQPQWASHVRRPLKARNLGTRFSHGRAHRAVEELFLQWLVFFAGASLRRPIRASSGDQCSPNWRHLTLPRLTFSFPALLLTRHCLCVFLVFSYFSSLCHSFLFCRHTLLFHRIIGKPLREHIAVL